MSSSSRFCFNRECSEFNLKHYRPGWRLRTGDFADLCDRCASAYEQGKFCDIFHLRASGWRCCESCGKKIHCGCVVSTSNFILLDAGGVECLACARKKFALGPKFSTPPSYLFQSPIAQKFKDLSINWSSSTGPNQMNFRPPSFLGRPVLQFDLLNRRDNYEFSQPTSKDKATAYSAEKKRGTNDLMGILMGDNSKCHTSDILNYQKAGPDFKVPRPNVNVYHPLISLKEGPYGTQRDFPVPITTPIQTNGHSGLDGSNLWHTPKADLNGGADLPFGSKSWNSRTHVDTPGKYQVVPRYWPKVSYESQVLQNPFKESESVVTPLFEKILSASDTGRVGRLVIPKKFAEAFLPRITTTGGVPLKVQDSMGKEWTFQFRFWPNTNSRLYVLEGVNPCIQSMQLQAGDTVIFSRLDPEGKLIMGFRKASVPQSSDQETDSTHNNRDSCTNGDAEPVDADSPSKETTEFSSGKKKSSMMITRRSKRQKIKKGDHNELMLTCEEAQGFMLPPPNSTPSVIKIEGFEFEEYEDAPIIGEPITGSAWSGDQELLADDHDEKAMEETKGVLMSPNATTKHPRHRSGCTCIVCIQSPSGKGPKHDRCCSCSICDTVKRRRRSLLLRRKKKKQIEKENKAKEKLESQKKLHQSANNSRNTSKLHKNHASALKAQIDLNFQPEKDEESLPGSNASTENKSLHHDDTSFKPPPPSSPPMYLPLLASLGKIEVALANTKPSSI
ncbi:unnamed protein product [Microthlaspi erraticum]|uniref:TF-B3 domain-containing protein n=1 Tax=Microthlaspi erraticum TaxID=1685480 RepID=A0A6D2L3Z7_9BRAS|nr:unnamed protein product [Microthlaspi erraticum]